MASRSNAERGGITTALKQVFYIHRGIVADLTAKNQILTAECEKLRNQLKQLAESTSGQRQCCVHQQRQSEGDGSNTTPREEGALPGGTNTTQPNEGALPAQPLQMVNSATPTAAKTKRQPSRRESYLSVRDRAEAGSEKDLQPSCKKLKISSPALGDSEESTNSRKGQSEPLTKDFEQSFSQPHTAAVLVPETELVETRHPVSKKQSRFQTAAALKALRDISFSGDENGYNEMPSPRMLTVPETLDVEAIEVIDIDDQQKYLAGCQSNMATSTHKKGKGFHSSLQQPIDTCHQKQIPVQEGNTKAQPCKTFNEEAESDVSTDTRVKTSKENQLRQTTLSQMVQKKNLVKNSISNQDFESYEDPDGQIAEAIKLSLQDTDGQIAEAMKLSLQDTTMKSALNPGESGSEIKEINCSLKLPISGAHENHFKLPSSSPSHKTMSSERKQTSHSSRTSLTNMKPTSSSSPHASLDPNGSVDPGVHFSEYLETERDRDNRDTTLLSHCSLDETIAPNLLVLEQQTQETRRKSAIGRGLPNITQCSTQDGPRNHSKETASTSFAVEINPSSGKDQGEDGSSKSPGNKKSLKLRKSDTSPRSMQSDKETAKKPEILSDKIISVATGEFLESAKNFIGMQGSNTFSKQTDDGKLSDDSDEVIFLDKDFDEETIAPSPQQNLTGSDLQQSVPCTSRSYRFVSNKHFRRIGSSLEKNTLNGSQSIEIDADDDNDLDEEDEPEKRHGRVKVGEESLRKGDATLVECQEEGVESLPELDEDLSQDATEDSFDRVPKAAVQPEIPHVEVVRKRSERDKLDGVSCQECREYYKNYNLSEEELKQKMKHCSRHKERYRRPATPEHFWTLGMPDTAEMIDRQRPRQHGRDSPVATEKRPRRKRQLEMKF